MKTTPLIIVVALVLVVLIGRNYDTGGAVAAEVIRVPPATPLEPDGQRITLAIRSLEAKVKENPDDFIAYAKLTDYYLQRQRETGSNEYLTLAERAARASLAVVPPEQNYGGLLMLARVEYTMHNFTAARDHATQLTNLNPEKSSGFEILSDALFELGEYDSAQRMLERMQRVTRKTTETQTRLGKHALLHGRTAEATRYLSEALLLALEQSPPSRETVAWCRWQLGEIAFSVGDYPTAERHYREALVTFSDYPRALAGLGRVRFARGDLPGAIELYERAVSILPDITFVAVLGDLYTLAGREKDAAAQHALIGQIALLNRVNGTLYDRQLALFYADHDMHLAEAYQKARKEYEVRRDIYGADAVAWTALKAGKVREAQTAIEKALRLGTQNASLYYHAGMIAQRQGKQNEARSHLQRALRLNPRFQPIQADIAEQTLALLHKTPPPMAKPGKN